MLEALQCRNMGSSTWLPSPWIDLWWNQHNLCYSSCPHKIPVRPARAATRQTHLQSFPGNFKEYVLRQVPCRAFTSRDSPKKCASNSEISVHEAAMPRIHFAWRSGRGIIEIAHHSSAQLKFRRAAFSPVLQLPERSGVFAPPGSGKPYPQSLSAHYGLIAVGSFRRQTQGTFSPCARKP